MFRLVALSFVFLGSVACTSASHRPIGPKETPVTNTLKPQPSSADAPDPFAASHVLLRDEEWYADGPHQARPPDGVLQAGTRVRLLRVNGSYSVIEMSNGATAHVATGSLTPL